jgi:hypothetical protein
MLIPRKYVSASLSCVNIPLKDAGRPGFVPPFTLLVGVHTMPQRFGAQGITVAIEPVDDFRIRFRAAEEYWIDGKVGLGAAISTNPLMAGFSVTVAVKQFTGFVALVHHPVLGWSKGAGTDWAFKKNKP